MILLDDDFLKNELDYTTTAENRNAYYKEVWYMISSYICKPSVNRLGLTYTEVEDFVKNGTIERRADYVCPIKDEEERLTIFKRAMGLQLIYDENNGKNIMQRGTNNEEDICRECYLALKSIGLIQPIGW